MGTATQALSLCEETYAQQLDVYGLDDDNDDDLHKILKKAVVSIRIQTVHEFSS